MHDLRLVGVTQDGGHLLLRAANGAESSEYRVPIDERLHAALRGDRARLGQLAIHQDGQATPREIQARVRAGESAESVAASAGVPVERIRRFAQPVLDERAHVADRARRGGVRGTGGEHHAQSLDEALLARLGGRAGHVTHPSDLDVDAFRGDDGRWSVVTSWTQEGEPRRAVWSFDGSRTSVQPASDEARWLAGEIDDPALPRPGSQPSRLAVVPDQAGEGGGEPLPGDDWPALGDDVPRQPSPEPELGGEPDTAPVPVLPAGAEPPRPAGPSGRRPRVPPLVARDTDPGRLRLSDIADHVDHPAAPDSPEELPSTAPGTPRRPSMPSWDEIMFGRRRHD